MFPRSLTVEEIINISKGIFPYDFGFSGKYDEDDDEFYGFTKSDKTLMVNHAKDLLNRNLHGSSDPVIQRKKIQQINARIRQI